MPPVDFFIVNVALSSIHESLRTTPAETQLVISGYAAGYAVFLITGGRLGDLFGRRTCYLWGMAAFALTNLLCGIAQSPPQLLVGRVLQGMTAAMLVPQVLASIRALHRDDAALARALGVYGMMMGLAAATGQLLGGVLVQLDLYGLGWRSIFLIKLPICVVTLALAWRLVPETSGGQRVQLDAAAADDFQALAERRHLVKGLRGRGPTGLNLQRLRLLRPGRHGQRGRNGRRPQAHKEPFHTPISLFVRPLE